MSRMAVRSLFSLSLVLLLVCPSHAFPLNLTELGNKLPLGMAGVGGPFAGIGAATFYGTGDGGACGYEQVVPSGYGPLIAAGSPRIFKGGLGCGACYKIKCVNSQYCKGTSIVVPIVDLCPGGNWCCPDCTHFDLSQAAFNAIAEPAAGHVPLQYNRVPCAFSGDMRLTVTGTPYWFNLLLRNVAGGGEISNAEVQQAGSSNWIPLTHSWGANWAHSGYLQAPLTFRFTSGLDGTQVVTKQGCLPNGWIPGDFNCGQQLPGSVEGGNGGDAPSQTPATPEPTPATPEPTPVPAPALQDGGNNGGTEGFSSGPPKVVKKATDKKATADKKKTDKKVTSEKKTTDKKTDEKKTDKKTVDKKVEDNKKTAPVKKTSTGGHGKPHSSGHHTTKNIPEDKRR